MLEIGADGAAVFLADVVHHTSHVEHPEWDRGFDTDPESGLATRRDVARRGAGAGVACAASHIPGWARSSRGERSALAAALTLDLSGDVVRAGPRR